MKKIGFSKIKVIRAILLALIISVMVIIFALSAQDSNDSGMASGWLTETIFFFLGIDGDSITEEEFIKIEGFIRSAAHFSEYALLAFLAAFLLKTYSLSALPVLGFSVAFSSLYAITDEIHQIFVPGRAAQISDWLVDTSGALAGAAAVLLLLALAALISKKHKKKKKSRLS